MTTPDDAPPLRSALAFLPGIAERLGWYVYALRDPRDGGSVFYVGKGKGDRVYQHAVHAKSVGEGGTAGLKLSTIREIHHAGLDVGVEILRHQIADEATAYEVEAAAIDAVRLAGVNLSNAVRGHGTARGWRPFDEIVTEHHAKPVTIPDGERVVLIRINRLYRSGMSAEEMYEVTRKWWRKGAGRNPEWAFAVYHGIVRAVYRIDGPWYHPEPNEADDRTRTRKAFNGVRDVAMEDRYLWTDVSAYLPKGLQTPLRYVNC